LAIVFAEVIIGKRTYRKACATLRFGPKNNGMPMNSSVLCGCHQGHDLTHDNRGRDISRQAAKGRGKRCGLRAHSVRFNIAIIGMVDWDGGPPFREE
jgi:hypothetical protein